MNKSLIEQAREVKSASLEIANASLDLRNSAVIKIANALETNIKKILSANKIDMKIAKEKETAQSMLDRLLLNEARIRSIAQAARDIVGLPDVLVEIETFTRPNGLLIRKQAVPLGVVGIIYEARPNVTVDCAVLCIKSGNAVILRGGTEAHNTNLELVRIMKTALAKVGLSENIIEILQDASKETAREFMRLNDYIDLLFPRGGKGLINAVMENATIPVLYAGAGNCHTYIDEFADLKMGLNILINAKTQRPSVCNACETLLVHEKIADEFLKIAFVELKKCGVDIRYPASENDLLTEFNDLVLAVKVVKNVDEAIAHIEKYGTKHSECIVTNNKANADKFTQLIDSAVVYVNASTRFTDGHEFGFGAEIGISTQKLHARGAVGLKELTTYKYIVLGNGQIRK